MLILGLAEKNPCDDEPLDESNGGVDGDVLPEYVLWLRACRKENDYAKADPNREAKNTERSGFPPPCVRLPEAQSEPAPRGVTRELDQDVDEILHGSHRVQHRVVSPSACRRSRLKHGP